MSRRAQENVVAGALLVAFGAILAISLTYGPQTRMVPVPVAVFSILLIVAQLIVQNRGSEDDLHVDVLDVLTRRNAHTEAARMNAAAARPRRSPGAATDVSVIGRREALALGLVLALLALFMLFGPILAIFLFIFGYSAMFGRLRWYATLSLAIGVSGSLYLLFVVLLHTQLFPGYVPGLL
ncbi:MAG: tripartite tricarboxylate transporter TctB family protein [Deinococcales bacterium]